MTFILFKIQQLATLIHRWTTGRNIVPLCIHNDEWIGRAIFSRTDAERIKRGNSIPYRVLFTKTQSISVDRLFEKALLLLTRIQRAHAKKRSKNQGRQVVFCGWLSLKAHVIRQEGRRLEASPQNDNPYHANIIMPSEERDDLIHQAKNLASLRSQFRWRGAPPI